MGCGIKVLKPYLCTKLNVVPKHTSRTTTRPGLADEDYYFTEDGLMVFTAAYHLKRGYCCKSGCRHCPYGFPKPAVG